MALGRRLDDIQRLIGWTGSQDDVSARVVKRQVKLECLTFFEINLTNVAYESFLYFLKKNVKMRVLKSVLVFVVMVLTA